MPQNVSFSFFETYQLTRNHFHANACDHNQSNPNINTMESVLLVLYLIKQLCAVAAYYIIICLKLHIITINTSLNRGPLTFYCSLWRQHCVLQQCVDDGNTSIKYDFNRVLLLSQLINKLFQLMFECQYEFHSICIGNLHWILVKCLTSSVTLCKWY